MPYAFDSERSTSRFGSSSWSVAADVELGGAPRSCSANSRYTSSTTTSAPRSVGELPNLVESVASPVGLFGEHSHTSLADELSAASTDLCDGLPAARSRRSTGDDRAPASRASTANIANVGIGITTASPGPTACVVTSRMSSSAPAPGTIRCGGRATGLCRSRGAAGGTRDRRTRRWAPPAACSCRGARFGRSARPSARRGPHPMVPPGRPRPAPAAAAARPGPRGLGRLRRARRGPAPSGRAPAGPPQRRASSTVAATDRTPSGLTCCTSIQRPNVSTPRPAMRPSGAAGRQNVVRAASRSRRPAMADHGPMKMAPAFRTRRQAARRHGTGARGAPGPPRRQRRPPRPGPRRRSRRSMAPQCRESPPRRLPGRPRQRSTARLDGVEQLGRCRSPALRSSPARARPAREGRARRAPGRPMRRRRRGTRSVPPGGRSPRRQRPPAWLPSPTRCPRPRSGRPSERCRSRTPCAAIACAPPTRSTRSTPTRSRRGEDRRRNPAVRPGRRGDDELADAREARRTRRP